MENASRIERKIIFIFRRSSHTGIVSVDTTQLMKFKDLADKKILILGFGKEGKATREFLQMFVPTAAVSSADQKDGSDYLAGLDRYDVVIKAPGIPKRLLSVP